MASRISVIPFACFFLALLLFVGETNSKSGGGSGSDLFASSGSLAKVFKLEHDVVK